MGPTGSVYVITILIRMALRANGDACSDDAPYKAIALNLGGSLNTFFDLAEAHKNDYYPGPFLQQLINIEHYDEVLNQIDVGNTTLYPQCLEAITVMTNAIAFAVQHAFDPVPGTQPYTGEALYQDALQAIGRAYLSFFPALNNSANAGTKYHALMLNEFLDIFGPGGAYELLDNNDNGPQCIVVARELADNFIVFQHSVNDTSTDCGVGDSNVAPTPLRGSHSALDGYMRLLMTSGKAKGTGYG